MAVSRGRRTATWRVNQTTRRILLCCVPIVCSKMYVRLDVESVAMTVALAGLDLVAKKGKIQRDDETYQAGDARSCPNLGPPHACQRLHPQLDRQTIHSPDIVNYSSQNISTKVATMMIP